MSDRPQSLSPPQIFLLEAQAYGIAFDPGDLERLGLFLELLLAANARFNLTAITDPAEAWMKHVFDSLTLMPCLEAAEANLVIDVGSGGGLPGVPLAIAEPAVRFVLLEATGKKAEFLRQAVEVLALENAEVVNERAETIGQDRQHHREHYDAVIARAVGKLAVVLELTVSLARVGGHVLTIKGAQAGKEIEEAGRALRVLHCEIVHTARTPTGTILVIEKRRPTGMLYPRRPGEPKRAPL